MAALRIVIADDHPIVRLGVKAFLAEQPLRFRLVGEAASGDALLALLNDTPDVDVVVTDFAMDDKGQDGLRLLRRIRTAHPQIKIVVLTMLSNGALLRSIQSLGVQCIVGKRGLHENLMAAIDAAARNRPFLSPDLQAILTALFTAQPAPASDTPNALLSARQIETLRLLHSGMTVSEIAVSLSRRKKTVSAHKQTAMMKLGLTNDAQLFEYLQNAFLESGT
jgi:two-component system capsular synthesis response regulator RcsB